MTTDHKRDCMLPAGRWLPFWLLAVLSILASTGWAAGVLETHKLADDVYLLVGPLTNRTPENLGNNANFGVVVTGEGVVLIDPGGTYQGARMIHAAIREITDKPVTLVINTGGQDHRWLGNGYFKELGARIVASEQAVVDQHSRLQDQFFRLSELVGNSALAGTEPVYAQETFSEQMVFTIGNTRLELFHAGHAHTPGDIFVWLPAQSIVFTGDIVYVDRMLGVGAQSAHRTWISAFEALAALEPSTVAPGHGKPTTLEKATAETYDYLVFLRRAVRDLIDEGHGMESVGSIDQSAFGYLEGYESLKGRNAQRIYEELEWE